MRRQAPTLVVICAGESITDPVCRDVHAQPLSVQSVHEKHSAICTHATKQDR